MLVYNKTHARYSHNTRKATKCITRALLNWCTNVGIKVLYVMIIPRIGNHYAKLNLPN